ncbi:MAG: hypothetical protein LQ340_002667 [Diploschistes diacapsis]|nr:MAG: hypothetical protein LQ340_002667 [Diploschistes diacapsis]
MTSDDFADAQQRVIARQQRRLEQAQAAGSLRHKQLSASPQFAFPGRARLARVWDSIKGREGTGPAFRVGQLDSELLDEELLELLKGQVQDGLKFFGSHLVQDWSSEITLLLRAILFKLSIWDNNASYGAALQGLEYRDTSGTLPSRWQKALYGLLTVCGRYGWVRWEEHLMDRSNVLTRLTTFASTTHDIASFVSFLIFLVNGHYRTLLDRVLRLRLVAPSNQINREVSFEYLNRQLVWHAFTEFLLFLLPLLGVSRWRRWANKAWRKARTLTKGEDEGGELSFLPERTCAICYQEQNPTSTEEVLMVGGGIVGSAQTDITNPYEGSCGCVYCYVCLATRLIDGEGFLCLRCGEIIKKCKPWAGDVVEGKKSVTFHDEYMSDD